MVQNRTIVSPMRTTHSVAKELIVFFTITFAISWSMAALILTGAPEMPMVLPLVFGPSFGAIITTAIFHGREGLRDFFRRYAQIRVPWYAYAIVTLGFLAIGFAGVILWRAFGQPWLRPVPALPVILQVAVFQLLVPGLGEEPGWRGFALPRLLGKMERLPASLLLGAIHWAWHLPTFWLGTGMHNVPAVWSMLYILGFTIVFTWVAERSNHSIFIAILFHGLHGMMLSVANFLPTEAQLPITPNLLTSVWAPAGMLGPYLIVTVLLLIAAALIIVLDWNRVPRRHRHSPLNVNLKEADV